MGAAEPKFKMRFTMPPVKIEDLRAGTASRSAARTFSVASTSLIGRSMRPTRLTCTLAACDPVLAVKRAVRPPGNPVSEIIVL